MTSQQLEYLRIQDKILFELRLKLWQLWYNRLEHKPFIDNIIKDCCLLATDKKTLPEVDATHSFIISKLVKQNKIYFVTLSAQEQYGRAIYDDIDIMIQDL